MSGKKYFTMERYEADKEEARKAMQLDSNELNHTDQLTAWPDRYRKENLHQHSWLDWAIPGLIKPAVDCSIKLYICHARTGKEEMGQEIAGIIIIIFFCALALWYMNDN